MAETKQVLVPDIGDFKDVPVIELLVKLGDTVRMEDPLISLESDKATIEVPSPLDGVIKEISVKLGDKVSQGSLILTVEVSTTIHASSSSATETRTRADQSGDNFDLHPCADSSAPACPYTHHGCRYV